MTSSDRTTPSRPGRLPLHHRNLRHIRPDDIVVASHWGAGASLLGNILLELGLDYRNPGTEDLAAPAGTLAPGVRAYRNRLKATAHRDTVNGGQPSEFAALRFIKTHAQPDAQLGASHRAIWILVRDVRDSLYSWFHWSVNFPDDSRERFTGSFDDFLAHHRPEGLRPVEDWCHFYSSWLRRASEHELMVITRFEDLKGDGVRTVQAALRTLQIPASTDAIMQAVERQGYCVVERQGSELGIHGGIGLCGGEGGG
jgi:hypothetical protein